MSLWRDQRNAAARVRFARACPEIFPGPVLVHAERCALVPGLPSHAIARYWRAHPIRADRLARALAKRSGAPEGWRWRVSLKREGGLPARFRVPPTPFREAAFDRGAGHCCVCGQPVFRFGWHVDLWGDGKLARGRWHGCCVAAWKLWTAPNTQGAILRRLQQRRCAATNRRLLRGAEVDHAVPLFEVWRDHRESAWPDLLRFWGFPNFRMIDAAVHGIKSSGEATARAMRRAEQRLPAPPGRSLSEVGRGQDSAVMLTMSHA